MGCAASALQDVDTLPIKAHCRTAFSRSSTTDHVNGQTSDNYLPNQSEEGYDVVLCYPLGGTVFGLELQARYEKMDTVSLWTLGHFLSIPGTPVGVSKSMSGGGFRDGCVVESGLEIRPAPEDEGAFSSSSTALSREVRRCRRGVVVLVTAGCTWDDGVLTCLRLTGKFLRPLVMVHCVQSCPLPALEEWPPDVRPIIAASGPPVKYLAQHSGEALRHVERRMVAASAALALAAAGAAAAASQDQGQQGVVQRQQQQQQGGATQQQGAVAPQTPPLQPPSRQQGQQQQLTAVMSGNCGGCLDSGCWTQPPPQQQQPAQGSQPAASAAGPDGTTPLVCAANQGPTSGSLRAGAAQGPGTDPDSGSLSLAALQESNSDICRRALQLLGPWTCSGAQQHGSDNGGGAAGAVPAGASTGTLVETLLVVSARPSHSTNMLSAKGAGAGAPSSGMSPPARDAGPGSVARPHQQQQERMLLPPQQQQQEEQEAHRAGVEVGGGAARCVLRYRDPGWATPVAFLCAQLEAELGRANVCVQVSPVAGAASKPIRHPSPAPATGTAVRVSLQSVDSGSSTWRQQAKHQEQQQQQRRPQQAAVSATVSAAAVAAAATALRGAQRSSSSGSSSRCSASGGGIGGGCTRLSGSTSRRTSGGLSPPIIARVDDELEAYATSPADDCTTPLLAAMSVSSSVQSTGAFGGGGGGSVAASVAAPSAPLAEFQSVLWPEEDSAPPPPPPPPPGGGTAVLVYFMSPGLSAPLGCLAELGAGLAAGRRVVLVVDGECCQRLPDYAPTGTTPEVWKALGRLWQERMLYVPDYHIPFCALLKQGIVGTVSPR